MISAQQPAEELSDIKEDQRRVLYGRNLVPCGSQIGGRLHMLASPAKLIVVGIVSARGSPN